MGLWIESCSKEAREQAHWIYSREIEMEEDVCSLEGALHRAFKNIREEDVLLLKCACFEVICYEWIQIARENRQKKMIYCL